MSLAAAGLCFFALPLGRPICARRRHVALGLHCGTRTTDLGGQVGRQSLHGFPLRSARRLICGDDVAALTLIVGTKTAEQVRSPHATCKTHRATRNVHHIAACSTQRTSYSASARKEPIAGNADRARVRGAFRLCRTDGCARLGGGQAAKHDRPITHTSLLSVYVCYPSLSSKSS